MCLAIVKPKGITIPEEYLRNGFENNSDGCGLCYAYNGTLNVVKSFDIDRFIEEYSVVEHLDLLIHFRFATHGDKDEANCHPWMLLDGRFALIHNGILNIKCEDKAMSDTGHFCKQVLEPIARRMRLDSAPVHYLIEQAIGNSNKLAVMDTDGDCAIFNEDQGEWVDGVWYSNNGYKTERFLPYWRSQYDFDKLDEDGWMSAKQQQILRAEEREELIQMYIEQGWDKDDAITVADADIEMTRLSQRNL